MGIKVNLSHLSDNPHYTHEDKQRLANKMRRNPTLGEAAMRDALRKHLKVRFRSQIILHGWIVDFWNERHRLVIEVDGGSHYGREEEDAFRDETLLENGITTLRFTDVETIYFFTEKVLPKIEAALQTSRV